MSDKFLNNMTSKEYNEYHRDLFGNDWKDVEFEGRFCPSLFRRLLDKIKQKKQVNKKCQ